MLIKQEFWIPLCRQHHDWVTNHPDKAREMGFICEVGGWNRLPRS